jgi:hypothetical protein
MSYGELLGAIDVGGLSESDRLLSFPGSAWERKSRGSASMSDMAVYCREAEPRRVRSQAEPRNEGITDR